MTEPRIVCAAIHLVDGLVIPSARHFDMNMRLLIVSARKSKKLAGARQGFIDQHGAFYTREEAWTVAKRQGQIRRDLDCGEGVLYSEHLY